MKISEKIKRRNSLIQFGYGTDVMRSTTVCTECQSLENSRKMFCSKCGTRLPRANLFDYYRAQHRSCHCCGNVLSDSMSYCPECGAMVKESAIL